MNVIPFFVADRPMSLRIIKGLPVQNYPDVHIGIMAHANTTLNFQLALNAYPCDNEDYCDAVKGPCKYRNDHDSCAVRKHILQKTVKMCDSGIFTRKGATLTYQQLFEAYERMGVEYGVMIDVFRNSQATLESAREALQVYEPFKDTFHLVAVAQGKEVEEYIKNYQDLKALGFSYIAVGGLLQKIQNTARYTKVRNENFMNEVLEKLRAMYPHDWLFALGCFSPGRLNRFIELSVWGDYKGWIFQYEKRNQTLDTLLDTFLSHHLSLIDDANKAVVHIKECLLKNIAVRSDRSLKQGVISKQLFRGHQFDKHELAEKQNPLDTIQESKELKKQIENFENQLNSINIELAKEFTKLLSFGTMLSEETKTLCTKTITVIESTEREYRFTQVQNKMTEVILAPIESTISMQLVTC